MDLTDPEIVAMGYDLPTGTDWVRDGDNNISKNARTTANALVDLEARLPRARGTLPDGTDLDAIRNTADAGTYELATSTQNYVGLPEHPEILITSHPTLVVHASGQTYASAQTIFFTSIYGTTIVASREYRELAAGFSRWTLYGVSTGASAAILDLARRDGWHAVYDPTNVNTAETDSSGRVTRLQDGLRNLPALSPWSGADPQVPPQLLAGEYGQLDGLTNGGLFTSWSTAIDDDIATMTVATPQDQPGGGFQYLTGGVRGAAFDIYHGNIRRWSYGTGFVNYGEDVSYNSPSIIEAVWPATDRNSGGLKINGQHQKREVIGSVNTRLRSISLGDYAGTGSYAWAGSFGVHLVYVGKISQEKLNRMRALLMSLTGIGPDRAPFNPETRVLTVDGKDNVVQAKGDPDAIFNEHVASISKIIPALMLRHYLPENEWDSMVTMEPEDKYNDSFQFIVPGDTLTWRNAVRAMAKNSDNNVSGMIAREMYTRFFPTKYPGMTYYQAALQEADTLLNQEWGLTGACMRNFNGGARLSTRHTAKLMRMVIDDDILRDCFNSDVVEFAITGDNPRTFTAEHTVESTGEGLFIAKKIGNSGIRRHTVTAWEHPTTKEEMITVIQDVYLPSRQTRHSRIKEYEVAQDEVLSGIKAIDTARPVLAGADVQTTHQRIITDEIGGITAGEIYIVRTDSTVSLTLENIETAGVDVDRGIPVGFRPYVGLSHPTGDGLVSINALGRITIPATSEPISLNVTYLVAAEYSQNFPQPPWPGKSILSENRFVNPS